VKQLRREILHNHAAFADAWHRQLTDIIQQLGAHAGRYEASYLRLVSLQAWRADVIEGRVSSGATGFFLEAQNDSVTSHALARTGAWRSALKSLRSSIENILQCVYYMDHPVELRLWHQGRHRLGFAKLVEYAARHPDVSGVPQKTSGLEMMVQEYHVLSRAVHGSAATFRMTRNGTGVVLYTAEASSLGEWCTREKRALRAINLLLLTLFRNCLQGAAQPNLRKAVAFALAASDIPEIRSRLGINIPHA
jgi:hypothetical protein